MLDKLEVITMSDSKQIRVKMYENTMKSDESDAASHKAPLDGTIGFIGPAPTVNLRPNRQRKPPQNYGAVVRLSVSDYEDSEKDFV